MLIQLILDRPQVIPQILAGTPAWVWGLLAALVALGASQLRDRTASLARVSVMPIGMTAFSLWGTLSALAGSPLLAQALTVWLAAAVALWAVIAPGRGAGRYDPATQTYALPGSVLPLLLILAIFLLKYGVGVELRMAPHLLHDATYMLTVTACYGALSGMFLGRAARLWRLALQARATPALG